MQMHVFALSAAGLALAACSAPGNPVLGGWTCAVDKGDQKLNATVNYASDGKESGVMTLEVQEAGGSAHIELSFVGKWKLREDQLEEEMSELTVMSATINGQSVPAEALAPMVDSMKGQTTTSTITVANNTLTLKGVGETSTCTR